MESQIRNKSKEFTTPKADKVAHHLAIHNDNRIDDYYWMRLTDEQKNAKSPDEDTTKVVGYLEAENEYLEKVMGPLEGFKNKLYDEIIGRIKQTDMSVPYKYNGYFYITRYEEGMEYPIHSRKKEHLEADEEIMLNVNELASAHDFYAVGGRNVSPNNGILAYGEDTLSRRIYTIKFKNLVDGSYFEDRLENTTGNVVWANDNKTVFYTIKDHALRSYKIIRHTLGTPQSSDVEVYHDPDETFRVGVYKTKSKKYIVIGSLATLSSEYHILTADEPYSDLKLFHQRERKLEHSISHYNDRWYILTNKDEAENFKLMSCPEFKTSKENWIDFIAHRPNVLLEGVDIFKDYYVLSERENGLTQLKIHEWNSNKNHVVDFGESVYSTWTSTNMDFDTEILRLGFTSLTTPTSTFDYNMSSQELKLLKQQEVVGGYNASDYEAARYMVVSSNGVKVPLSIVHKKGFKKDGTQPVLLYGYGSYGASMDPYFSSTRLSLLDRGFAFAIAHIRGGQELGRRWYEHGKFLKKKNTFTDFIDCGKFLIENKIAAKDQLYASGGSAGGLLIGAAMNMAPELWSGLIAAVPFVDVLTTMLDESIPLTTGEFDEWGNPNNKEYYFYMKSYSPYDNIEKVNYPPLLVTTGYHDSQVQYWEPAKWVAKLRDYKTDDNPLLFHTNLDAGHGGQSGRFRRYKEVALEYCYLLDLAGRAE